MQESCPAHGSSSVQSRSGNKYCKSGQHTLPPCGSGGRPFGEKLRRYAGDGELPLPLPGSPPPSSSAPPAKAPAPSCTVGSIEASGECSVECSGERAELSGVPAVDDGTDWPRLSRGLSSGPCARSSPAGQNNFR